MGMRELEARLDALELRVGNIEQHAGVPTLEDREAEQERQDLDILSRHPASYEEAVAFKAAQRRQAERDGQLSDDEASPGPETLPES